MQKKNILQNYLKKRKGFNQKVIKILKEMQMSPKRKKELSDVVIKNNFNPRVIRLKVEKVLDSIVI